MSNLTLAELASQQEDNVLRLLAWHVRDIVRGHAVQDPELFRIELQALGQFYAALDRRRMLPLASAAVEVAFRTKDMAEQEARVEIETWIKKTEAEPELIPWGETTRKNDA